MPDETIPASADSQAMTATKLREKLLTDKTARRRYLVSAPIPEKLRMLEEMRDVTRALKKTREENKTRIRAAVAQTEVGRSRP